MEWTEELVRELHREHIEDGVSVAALARRYDVTREALRQKFERYDLPRRPIGDQARRRREAQEQAVEASRERIITLYKEHGSIDAVMAEIDLPRDPVTAVINTIPNREAYRRRGTSISYSRDELIRALQAARDEMGEPLTIPNYRIAAKRLGLPSLNVVVQHFGQEAGGDPWWLTALRAAGVKGNAPRGRRASTLSEEDCVQAVVHYIRAHGGDRGSYLDYDAWAPAHGEPSGASLRLRLPWNTLVELALDRISGM